MKWFSKRVLVVVAGLATFACGGSSTTTPTAPTGSATLQTFTGGFGASSSGPAHNFTIGQSNGLLNIVLTSVTNASDGSALTVALGLALGSQSSSGCVAISG